MRSEFFEALEKSVIRTGRIEENRREGLLYTPRTYLVINRSIVDNSVT